MSYSSVLTESMMPTTLNQKLIWIILKFIVLK